MKFVNLKTCHGIESHVLVNGALLRLSLLPSLLRQMTDEEIREILEIRCGKVLRLHASPISSP